MKLGKAMKTERGAAVMLAAVLSLFVMGGCGQGKSPEFVIGREDVYTLSDGQSVSVGCYVGDSKIIYQLDDGSQLLAIGLIGTLDEVTGAAGERFQTLAPQARENILLFYEQQGGVYDVKSYLEKAYEEYTADPSAFRCWLLRQSRPMPVLKSESVLYCRTDIMLLLGHNEYDTYFLTQAFRVEDGSTIDGWELFSAEEEQIKEQILRQYTNDTDKLAALKEEFRPEYLCFYADGYEVLFPRAAAERIGEEGSIGFGGSYTEEFVSLLHSWALPGK